MKKNIFYLAVLLFIISNPFILFGKVECDTLTLISGQKIIVQDFKLLSEEIRYEKCNDDSGKIYILNKELFSSIKYSEKAQSNFFQKDSVPIYKIWIHQNSSNQTSVGLLYNFKDSSILTKPVPLKDNYLKEISINNIKYFQIRKDKKVGTSMGIGAISGLAVGFTIGQIIKSKNKQSNTSNLPASDNNLNISEDAPVYVFSALGILSGTIIGAIVGNIRINVPINGKQEAYEKGKMKLNF